MKYYQNITKKHYNLEEKDLIQSYDVGDEIMVSTWSGLRPFNEEDMGQLLLDRETRFDTDPQLELCVVIPQFHFSTDTGTTVIEASSLRNAVIQYLLTHKSLLGVNEITNETCDDGVRLNKVPSLSDEE